MHRPGMISMSHRAMLALVMALAGIVVAEPVMAASVAAAPGPVLSLPLPGPLPPIRVLTLLVGLHLVGLCFGLGGATMLDFWILRWMRWGGLPDEIARTFLFISKVVSVGLVLLWVSGLGFFAVYAFESPEKLTNPKLLAKVTVVAVLTVNGWLIHALVLPGVLRDVKRPMFEGVSRLRTGIFLISGAVSGVSWYTAFALGLMRELNGRVAPGPLLAIWFAATIAAAVAAYALWHVLCRQNADGVGERPEAEGAAAGSRWHAFLARSAARFFASPPASAAAPPLERDLRPHNDDAAPAAPPHPIRAIPLVMTCAPGSGLTSLAVRRRMRSA